MQLEMLVLSFCRHFQLNMSTKQWHNNEATFNKLPILKIFSDILANSTIYEPA